MLHTALKHWPAFLGEGGGGTLILSYISRFGPFLKVQNFECIFGVGRGREGQINKYVWGMMKILIFLCFVESFLSIWRFFYGQVRFEKYFLGLLNFKYFWGVPDILDIFGDKE